MNPIGTFICFGPETKPFVEMLSVNELNNFDDVMRIASLRTREPEAVRLSIYEQTFGKGVHFAIPCWDRNRLLLLIDQYEGPHDEVVRALAICVYMRRPFSRGKGYFERLPGDGMTVAPEPTEPEPRLPGGAVLKIPAEVSL
jgi:hypothetical protein